MSDELHDERLATPSDFASELFAFNNRDIFDAIVELRVQGIGAMVAYRMVMGESYNDNLMSARVYALETNPYYKRTLKHAITNTKFEDFWNPKTAVHELLSVVRDRWEKGSVRMSAIKELNVIADITIVDESGKTKAGRKLADFYAEEGGQTDVEVGEVNAEELPVQAAPHTTH